MSDMDPGVAQAKIEETERQTIAAFFSSVAVAFAVFGIQVLVFLIIKGKLPRIYRPKTYLVPEKDRVAPPPSGLWQWAKPIFRTSNSDFIQKCGLDAYFFLRYLRLLLKLFIPAAMVILPVLLPVNIAGGRGDAFASEPMFNSSNAWENVSGLNQLAWGNVRPTHTNRYWAHLILAVSLVVYACYIFFDELRGYIRLRQAYLTSPQHRLRASATTVLVSAIPRKWCTAEALDGLYDVYPGGIRNIWINRNFDQLAEKVKERNDIAQKLESAQTDLIKKAYKAHLEQEAKAAKKAGRQSKANKTAEAKKLDEEAANMANKERRGGHGGQSDGQDSQSSSRSTSPQPQENKFRVPVPVLGEGIDKLGQGMQNLGRTVFGGVRNVGKEIDGQITTTQGFAADGQVSDSPQIGSGDSPAVHRNRESTDRLFDPNSPAVDRTTNETSNGNAKAPEDAAAINSEKKVQVAEEPDKKKSKYDFLKFWQKEELPPIEYPEAANHEYNSLEDTEGGEPLWKKYVKPKDRDTMRLPVFGQKWLGWVPFVGEKVDTIDHCRKELARLNVEVEEDQKDPTRYPLMNSAFIQFNHQVAAHMACQTVSHHTPQQMAPRIVEIAPDDVLWDNMSVKWWERYLRTGGVVLLVGGLIIGWAFPVAFTGLLSNIQALTDEYPWLGWLNRIPQWFLGVIQGVLPQLLLAILLALLPIILRLLARMQGHATGMAIELAVQGFYFTFLFVQVFLVVTISSGAGDIISQLSQTATDPASITSLLASNLPQASNYFFSYLLLQALSTSAGTLVQIASLAGWFLLAPLFDSTARQKWKRQIELPSMRWGTFFPVYTNLAVIGIIYSVISPLILVFNIITFSLFWFAYRYQTLYVTKFRFDTGGLLFPTAINQLFTGLYVMELCMIGLFFLVKDVGSDGEPTGTPCFPQAIVMIIALILTIIYQWLLNGAFAPLFRYLPITLEDDAVIRDEEFARVQDKKRGLIDDEEPGEDINHVLEQREREERDADAAAEAIELQNIEKRQSRRFDPRKLGESLDPRKLGENLASVVPGTGSWTDRNKRKSRWEHEGDGKRAVDVNNQSPDLGRSHERQRRASRSTTHRQHNVRLPGDTEAQQADVNNIGDALFSGIHDEIEDLTPEERDVLVRRAFQHEALRARKPVIWIPRDSLGISDDEIKRTKKYSKNIWIDNRHTGLDSKARVVYRKSPPDFSEIDLIEL